MKIQISITMAVSQKYTFFFNLDLKTIVMNEMGGHPLGEGKGRTNRTLHLLSTYYVLCIYSII